MKVIAERTFPGGTLKMVGDMSIDSIVQKTPTVTFYDEHATYPDTEGLRALLDKISKRRAESMNH